MSAPASVRVIQAKVKAGGKSAPPAKTKAPESVIDIMGDPNHHPPAAPAARPPNAAKYTGDFMAGESVRCGGKCQWNPSLS